MVDVLHRPVADVPGLEDGYAVLLRQEQQEVQLPLDAVVVTACIIIVYILDGLL